MSLDILNECSACKAHGAARLWMAGYASPDHADANAGPEFLSCMVPGPAMLKVEICFLCGSMKALTKDEYTPEEVEMLEKRNAFQTRKKNLGDSFGKLFGGLGKKPDTT